MSTFNLDESLLNEDNNAKVELLLVKYHSIFARHWLDIGINAELKHNNMKNQSLQIFPNPTILKEKFLVEVALVQEYGIITTFLFADCWSLIFLQFKSKRKLRILNDLRRSSHLMNYHYGQHNHPLTTISDAAQHMAVKRYFCKLDSSEPYHCIQMADEPSVQLFSLDFGSEIFADKRLAQSLSKSLSDLLA